MNKKYKKIIAPVIIIALTVLWCVSIAFLIISDNYKISLPGIIITVVPPLFFAGVGIFVLIERIKEIKGGEEDDLSQY